MILNTTCLTSSVRNVSGRRMIFSFLPPHGAELDDNEEYTVFGNILEAICRLGKGGSKRQQEALQAAIENGDLEIVNTPAPIFYDADPGVLAPQSLEISNGVVAAIDPCWSESV